MHNLRTSEYVSDVDIVKKACDNRKAKIKAEERDLVMRPHSSAIILIKKGVIGVFLQIFVDLSRQDQLDVFHRRVVDQVV